MLIPLLGKLAIGVAAFFTLLFSIFIAFYKEKMEESEIQGKSGEEPQSDNEKSLVCLERVQNEVQSAVPMEKNDESDEIFLQEFIEFYHLNHQTSPLNENYIMQQFDSFVSLEKVGNA